MKEQTINKLREMKLQGFMLAYKEQETNSQYQDMTFEDRFSLLVEKEHLRRANNLLKRIRKSATLPISCQVADIDFSQNRGISKKTLLEHSNCSWIYQHKNLIITGATGCGKTYIASALSDSALKNGLKVKYYKTHDLLSDFHFYREKQELPKLLSLLSKFDLLVFDEWLRDNFELEESRFILDLTDLRFRNKSAVFISQLPLEKWHSRLGEPTIADAILDRIIHDSYKLSLEGDSMRKKTSNLEENI